MHQLKFDSNKLIKVGIEQYFSKITNYSFVVVYYPSESMFATELSSMVKFLTEDSVKFIDDQILVLESTNKKEHRQILNTLKTSRTQRDMTVDVYNGSTWRSVKITCKGMDDKSVLNSYTWTPNEDLLKNKDEYE